MKFLLLLLIMLLISPATRAALSEPDNLLYGVVSLNSQPITAARTDVVIEARRILDGPALARFRMGSDSRAGSFYSLRIPIESLGAAGNPSAAQNGENLYIVVSDLTGRRHQTIYTIADRAAVQRLDLGNVEPDSDDDTLPDAWELFHFGHLNTLWDTINANGLVAWYNYQAGTDPNNTNSLFQLTAERIASEPDVSFFARQASGIGYEGNLLRYYSLEWAPGAAGPWAGVPAFTNLLGNNQIITYRTPSASAPVFFRGRVWLQIP